MAKQFQERKNQAKNHSDCTKLVQNNSKLHARCQSIFKIIRKIPRLFKKLEKKSLEIWKSLTFPEIGTSKDKIRQNNRNTKKN